MNRRVDVAVVGAGMVGLTLARLLWLRSPGLTLAVIDAGRAPAFDTDADVGLRVSAVSPGSVSLLTECGAWQSIRATRAGSYSRMRVWDARGTADDASALHFSADELGLSELGFIVENELIRCELYRRLIDDDADVGWFFESRVTAIAPGDRAITLSFEEGRTLDARLLVGADGARSAVRRLAGLPLRSWRYPQDAFVTHVRPDSSHQSTAWQRFLPTGPIALLPLADGRCSVVWSTDPKECARLRALDDESLGGRITGATDGVLGALRVAGPRGSFPLAASYAPDYTGQRVVLAGDAAHAVHPLAGQGVNLGFGDAAALSRCIAEAVSGGEDPGDRPVLRRYERARKGENTRTLMFLDALQRFFGIESDAVARLRIDGMRIFNRLGPLKRMAVRHATGVEGLQ